MPKSTFSQNKSQSKSESVDIHEIIRRIKLKELKRRSDPKTSRSQIWNTDTNRWVLENGKRGRALVKERLEKYLRKTDLSKRVAALEHQMELQGKTINRHNSEISTLSYFMRNITRWVQVGGDFFKDN